MQEFSCAQRLHGFVVAPCKPICCCSHEVSAAREDLGSADGAVKDKPVEATVRFVLLWVSIDSADAAADLLTLLGLLCALRCV